MIAVCVWTTSSKEKEREIECDGHNVFFGCTLGVTTRNEAADFLLARGFDVQHLDSIEKDLVAENIMHRGVKFDYAGFSFRNDTLWAVGFVDECESEEQQDSVYYRVATLITGGEKLDWDDNPTIQFEDGTINTVSRIMNNGVCIVYIYDGPPRKINSNATKKASFFSAEVDAASTEEHVYICPTGSSYAYHRTSRCGALTRCSRTPKEITKSKAENMGRTPCGRCY